MTSPATDPGSTPTSNRGTGTDTPYEGLELSPRVRALDAAIRSAPLGLCEERAVLVTRFFKHQAERSTPLLLQKAAALAWILRHKQVRIYARELLVGCFTSHRVGGGIYPELHGVAVLEDLYAFDKRPVNPMTVSKEARRRLLTEVLPYWAPRFIGVRAVAKHKVPAFIASQLSPVAYLLNELGGVSHFVPDYEGLVTGGTAGYRRAVTTALAGVDPDSEEAAFLRSVVVACDGLEAFADGYRAEAERLATDETDETRRAELLEIARICGRIPREPAATLQEGLQSILFAQIALNLESLDNAISPGRLDQILMPLFEADLAAGRLDVAGAFELLGCFALKLCEIVPAFSRRLTRSHGGLFNGQVVVVGGVDREGNDATNALTWLFVELMDRLRTRQPNYHARLHPCSPPALRTRIAEVLADGAVSPALYNDALFIPMLEQRGISLEDARDYALVGCVEPVAAGRSFLSTDAALFNLPHCLELALNGGRRFGKWRRSGAATAPADRCANIDELFALFEQQLRFRVAYMVGELQDVERANANFHPTPLTSMLLQGCIESGRDSTAGGTRYNGSGIQGVGAVDVGDSLAAIQAVVFEQRHATLAEVITACRNDFVGADALAARLRGAPCFGNHDARADVFTGRVMTAWADALRGHRNTRGGDYVAGFYSVTTHLAFGEKVGALPSGRSAGQPFSSGISPTAGAVRKGPTAALASYATLPFDRAENGVNYNLNLPPWVGADAKGAKTLEHLVTGAFASGCMQLQVNVLDPSVLIEARDHPGRHPGLLVRVSGYSAYFDDLSPAMKQEIIDRYSSGSV